MNILHISLLEDRGKITIIYGLRLLLEAKRAPLALTEST